jgi:hypothetical protein
VLQQKKQTNNKKKKKRKGKHTHTHSVQNSRLKNSTTILATSSSRELDKKVIIFL